MHKDKSKAKMSLSPNNQKDDFKKLTEAIERLRLNMSEMSEITSQSILQGRSREYSLNISPSIGSLGVKKNLV